MNRHLDQRMSPRARQSREVNNPPPQAGGRRPGGTIEQFLREVQKSFKELARLSTSSLMYVKEDLIIPAGGAPPGVVRMQWGRSWLAETHACELGLRVGIGVRPRGAPLHVLRPHHHAGEVRQMSTLCVAFGKQHK